MSYLKLHRFLKDWFDNDPIINTITNNKEGQVDSNVNNIYPLANFYINSNNANQYNQYSCLVTLVDQVDELPKVNNSKLIDNTNHPDIVNELEYVMLRFLANLQEINNTDLISVVEIGTVNFSDLNGKVYVNCEITFELPNEVLNYK